MKPKRIVHVKPEIAAKRIENLKAVYEKQIVRYSALAEKYKATGNKIRENLYLSTTVALKEELQKRIDDLNSRKTA